MRSPPQSGALIVATAVDIPLTVGCRLSSPRADSDSWYAICRLIPVVKSHHFSAPHRTLRQLPCDRDATGPTDVRPLMRARNYAHRGPARGGDDVESRNPREMRGHIESTTEGVDPSGAGIDISVLVPPSWGQGFTVMPMEQRGVLRTNCIDCLDRTNVGQFSIGVHVLAKQLYVMGVSNQESLDSGSQARAGHSVLNIPHCLIVSRFTNGI